MDNFDFYALLWLCGYAIGYLHKILVNSTAKRVLEEALEESVVQCAVYGVAMMDMIALTQEVDDGNTLTCLTLINDREVSVVITRTEEDSK
ncbi:hypothetical protein [Methylobacter tundripaludum]